MWKYFTWLRTWTSDVLLKGGEYGSWSVSTLIMEAALFSETYIHVYKHTRRHNSEHRNLNIRRSKNLGSLVHILFLLFAI